MSNTPILTKLGCFLKLDNCGTTKVIKAPINITTHKEGLFLNSTFVSFNANYQGRKLTQKSLFQLVSDVNKDGGCCGSSGTDTETNEATKGRLAFDVYSQRGSTDVTINDIKTKLDSTYKAVYGNGGLVENQTVEIINVKIYVKKASEDFVNASNSGGAPSPTGITFLQPKQERADVYWKSSQSLNSVVPLKGGQSMETAVDDNTHGFHKVIVYQESGITLDVQYKLV